MGVNYSENERFFALVRFQMKPNSRYMIDVMNEGSY